MPGSFPCALAIAGLLVCFAVPRAIADEPPPVPDLGAQLTEKRAASRGDAGPLTAADRQTMQAAMAEVAERLPNPGLPPGTEAPDFRLPNALGEPVRLSDVLSQGPVVLTFYRGAWCPYCNLQLRALKQIMPRIERHGAELIAITPQKPDASLEQVAEDGYPFEILSDLDDRVMEAYHLKFELPAPVNRLYQEKLGLDLAHWNGDGRYVLPVPGTFVIDPDGVIRAAFARLDYTQRMEPAAILEALDTLSPPAGD